MSETAKQTRVQDSEPAQGFDRPADDRDRVLKDGDMFAVFDRYGDIRPAGFGEEGIFLHGTRFVSRWELRIFGERRPLLLDSNIGTANTVMHVDMTNPAVPRGIPPKRKGGRTKSEDGSPLDSGAVHIVRERFLSDGTFYERIMLANHLLTPLRIPVEVAWDGDFADIFEVRGAGRSRRGTREDRPAEGALIYRGLDDVLRAARLIADDHFKIDPDALIVRAAPTVAPGKSVTLGLRVVCDIGPSSEPRSAVSYTSALAEKRDRRHRFLRGSCSVLSSDAQFNAWVSRSINDLNLLVTSTPHGMYPYAGIPWFSTPFGRDGLIAALETLWVNPDVARGVLSFLAANQASERDPSREAEPGKIAHEFRTGEMAALGEVPYGLYFGSADSTPLFVSLAGKFVERTGDVDFAAQIWPHVEAALRWIDECGDSNGDGFIDYESHNAAGLANQGWRDADDAVFRSNGELVRGPIALCEVQAYCCDAFREAARLARLLGHESRAEDLTARADKFREAFEDAFWIDDETGYALALDDDGRPCSVRTSNMGHCLFAGIASPERARAVAEILLDREFFSGWGIRTVAESEVRFSPMSYHNGAVWPHDNALIAAGLSRYGLREQAGDVFGAIFEVSRQVEFNRLPELWCGFPRRDGAPPVRYPVACSPQAWSAGAVFLLLSSSLGMRIDGAAESIEFTDPWLPPFLDEVTLTGLQVGSARAQLALYRHGGHVDVHLRSQTGNVAIVLKKSA